jgi:hypothetical protein
VATPTEEALGHDASHWCGDACIRDAARSDGYEVFVRSFYDSDGTASRPSRSLPRSSTYINVREPRHRWRPRCALHVAEAVVESPSYHGYDAT